MQDRNDFELITLPALVPVLSTASGDTLLLLVKHAELIINKVKLINVYALLHFVFLPCTCLFLLKVFSSQTHLLTSISDLSFIYGSLVESFHLEVRLAYIFVQLFSLIASILYRMSYLCFSEPTMIMMSAYRRKFLKDPPLPLSNSMVR